MSEVKTVSAESTEITADEIILDITNTKDIEEMREDLRTLWDNFCISNDTTDADDRGNVFVTYKALYDALGKMDDYEEQKFLQLVKNIEEGK